MDILARLVLRIPGADTDVLEDCIETAKHAILSRRYPYGDWPTQEVTTTETTTDDDGNETTTTTTTEETYVEDRYLDLEFRIAMDLYNKIGAEGETEHSANGVKRVYESSWISEQLLNEIVPYVGTVT